MLKVVASNCGCCGVKHIRDFPQSPNDTVYPDKWDDGHDEDEVSTEPEPYVNWINHEDFPQSMKAGDAFEMIMKQIKSRRPMGMVTLNLAADVEPYTDDEFDDTQVKAWRPLLIDNGFTEVVFMNSNSSNRVHHFYRAYD